MRHVFITVLFIMLVQMAFCQVKLPAMIRDSMILQRNTKIRIWGRASKNEKITVRFNGHTYKTTASPDGRWTVWMAPEKAGGPYTMNISSSGTITLKDILVGDVWVCSGQSNMVHQMALHNVTYANDIATANYPDIRHFWIPTMTDLNGPHDDLPAVAWKAATPANVPEFSAVAYFFARKIYEQYHIPIGLINASVGGTPIEAWISEDGLKEFPSILQTINKNKDTGSLHRPARSQAIRPVPGVNDKGLTEATPWFDTSYRPTGWHTINIPGYWEDQGVKNLDGVVWYRKEIDIPANIAGKAARVFLGRIVDADALYINGRQVGNTTYMYPQRRYTVPAGVLKPGKNIFVIRVTNNSGKGGFVPDKPYYLFAGTDTIDLKGYWQYKVGEVFEPGAFTGGGISAQNQPSALYNAMIAPIINYSIRGFCWYQGEANTGRAEEYARLQPAQIADWRSKWQQGELPFLFVQLPNFMEVSYLPSESQWATLRESQLHSLSVPVTAMAVAIDLGEWNDIHPDKKKDVGERLARAAAYLAYNATGIEYSGPLFQSATVGANDITLSFTHTGSGLVSNNGEALSQFAIAGADKKFVWANARIEGNTVVVSSDRVPQPKYVRYAWSDNPDGANLYNKEGLPASPFRTDK